MAEKLKGRVAIVTGASSGIGWATAARLAQHGVRVAAAGRRAKRLEKLARLVRESGGQLIPVPTDVTDLASVRNMVEAAVREYGMVDILVNNAGVMPLSPIQAVRTEEWDRMIDVNVRGLLYCTGVCLPVMLDRGHGHIVNVGSVAGRRPFPAGTVYSATKFAVRAISAGLRLELSPATGIRVTDIEPGVVDTELQDGIKDSTVRERFSEAWGDKKPLSAGDVANAILYAVSQPQHVNVNEILLRPTDQEG